jgi:hypothetical protein
MIVTLTAEMIEYADYVAALRKGTAFFKGWAHRNGLAGTFDELFALERMGTRCEVAGKVCLNPIRWNAFAERTKGLADLGDFIDVKGCARESDRLVVQRDAREDFAFLQVCAARHPDYIIGKWVWGREAKQERFWTALKPGRPAYVLDPWREHEELRALVHERRLSA